MSETAVYGVVVPHADGRAGMAFIVLQPGAVFDPAAYYAFATAVLPSYARPLFVRLGAAMDVTGTLKHTKTRLQAEGYDRTRVADPLWLRDDAHATYVPFDADLARRLDAGELTF